jgi:hypothetical protein
VALELVEEEIVSDWSVENIMVNANSIVMHAENL